MDKPSCCCTKPSGDIRLCVDMRRANESIVRERLPIPTVDEVLESLNGSTVFSKLDLRWVFIRSNWNPARGILLLLLLMMEFSDTGD